MDNNIVQIRKPSIEKVGVITILSDGELQTSGFIFRNCKDDGDRLDLVIEHIFKLTGVIT